MKTRSSHDDLDLSDELASPSGAKNRSPKKKSSQGKSTKRSGQKKKKGAKTDSPVSPVLSRSTEPRNVSVELDEPESTPGPFNDFVIGGPGTIPNSGTGTGSLQEPSQTITAPVPPISYVPLTSSPPSQGQYYLLFISTPVSSLAHTRLPVDFEKSPTISIGRDSGNILVIPDQVVSRNHAELSIQDGRVYLKDRGSSNGTFLYDGTDFQPVQDSVEVHPNSVIRFGTTTIVKLIRE